MSTILHLWRESGAGGGPMAWWAGLDRSEQTVLLADARHRDRQIRRARDRATRGRR